ncbi:MAG TPA: peptidoglycan-binding protein [Candidatus Paceibacterota bacterium]|nr:peptidoglycan-binding protein [Candidatus Paceibacterota bacterium]
MHTRLIALLIAACMVMPVPAHAVTLTSDLSIGSRGAEVTQLQLILFQFGYSTAAPNGVYSETTADGVRALQKKYGLAVTGTVGAKTRALLNPFIARNPTSGSTRPAPSASGGGSPLMLGSSGPAVLEVQQKLAALGYFKETPTGYFGPITRAAVIAFQAARGLEQVGSVGPLTRAALAGAGPASATSGSVSSSSTGVSSASTRTATTGERPPALTFRIDRKFALVGDYVYLSWSAKRADTCTASGGWTGNKGVKGSESFSVPGDTTYTLTCTGSGGSITKSVWVSTTLVARKVEEPEEVTETPVVVAPVTPATPATPTTPSNPALPAVPATPAVPKPPIPTTLPGPSKNYQVYQGCEAPAKSYARVVYIDPQHGLDTGDGSSAAPLRTLQAAFSAKKLRAGDHVVLMPGNHGEYTGDGRYNQSGLFTTPNWIWLDFQEGAVMGRLELRNISRILITNPEFNPSAKVGQMLLVSGGTDLVVADGEFYSIKNSGNWSASDWLGKTSSGIFVRNHRCASVLDNKLRNVAFGISISTDGFPTSDNAARALVARNEIIGFQGDGIRPNASDVSVRDNRIIESMLGAADGDANHDDGIQIFALNGHEFSNIRIENNWIQETTSGSRPMIGSLQGIGHFDGIIKDSVVRNNVVLVSAYWGIALSGPKDSIIEKNTAVNSASFSRGVRIAANATKATWGSVPPQNTIVRDNVAQVFFTTTGTVTASNNVVVGQDMSNVFVTFDKANGTYDLRPKPGGPLDGKGAGASGISSSLGSQAVLSDSYAQTAGAANALPSLADLYQQLVDLLKTLK